MILDTSQDPREAAKEVATHAARRMFDMIAVKQVVEVYGEELEKAVAVDARRREALKAATTE